MIILPVSVLVNNVTWCLPTIYHIQCIRRNEVQHFSECSEYDWTGRFSQFSVWRDTTVDERIPPGLEKLAVQVSPPALYPAGWENTQDLPQRLQVQPRENQAEAGDTFHAIKGKVPEWFDDWDPFQPAVQEIKLFADFFSYLYVTLIVSFIIKLFQLSN